MPLVLGPIQHPREAAGSFSSRGGVLPASLVRLGAKPRRIVVLITSRAFSRLEVTETKICRRCFAEAIAIQFRQPDANCRRTRLGGNVNKVLAVGANRARQYWGCRLRTREAHRPHFHGQPARTRFHRKAWCSTRMLTAASRSATLAPYKVISGIVHERGSTDS